MRAEAHAGSSSYGADWFSWLAYGPAAIALVVLPVFPAPFVPADRAVPFAVAWAVAAGMAAWLVVGLFRARIVCSPDALVVRGAVASRRIPRSAIERVIDDPSRAFVQWGDVSGRLLGRPLFLLWGGGAGWMPRSIRTRRTAFLATVSKWASAQPERREAVRTGAERG